MTSRKYLSFIVIGALIVYGIDLGLFMNKVIHFNWMHFNVLNAIVFLLFVAGAGIVLPAIKKNPDNIVMPFMSLTTIQLLAAMAIIAAVIYTKQYRAVMISFNLIGVFLAMLTIQTVLLVRMMSSRK